MINNFLKTVLIIFFYLFSTNGYSVEKFNFDITEVEILENGNVYKGEKRGTVSTDDGIIVDADQFEYDKRSKILNAYGNVIVNDKLNHYQLYTDKIIYDKNKEIIFTKNNSKAIDLNDNSTITAKDFQYERLNNILTAKENVKLESKLNDYKIKAELAKYLRDDEKIFTIGKTSALIKSKYKVDTKNIIFLKIPMKLISNDNSTITDKNNLYNLKKFIYHINTDEIIGENINVMSNYKSPDSDRFYFTSANINLNTENFVAKDTKIRIHKSIFDDPENDPRLYGVSSSKQNNITTVNKGVFTPCKDNEKCPPWSIKAKKIQHDQNSKQLIYDHAVLRLYDLPVFYTPKFYHPDPTVRRLSGFLRPQINSSDELGDSIHLPYFYIISPTKDMTIRPTIFDNGIKMIQNEYRQLNANSEFITDFGLTTGYKPSYADKKKNLTHLFAKFTSDLKFNSFSTSDLSVSIERVSNDTYLKVFNTNFYESNLRPDSSNNLTSEIRLELNHNDYNLDTGLQAYEQLTVSKNSDRFQFILPYYNFTKNFDKEFFNGQLNFSSSGNNNLSNTNVLQSSINNNFDYKSNKIVSSNGIVNNFNIYFKNTSTVGKKSTSYRSSPEIDLWNINEYTAELPLIKTSENFNNFLTPKLSFRFNPTDMKDHSNKSRGINVGNIFSINRLGINNSYEQGRSLTAGINFKKEKLDDINKYFELKLASVFRDKEYSFIPKTSSLNKKNSALFGSIETKLSDKILLDYNFRLDNNYDKFEYNSIAANFIFKGLDTTFGFTEENGDVGDSNFLSNQTTYTFNDHNFITFKTRRNRKINFTEYYDLIYEYKNDCLVANIKYNKKFYSDRDLKPNENLLFSITFYPFTSYEHNETNLFK